LAKLSNDSRKGSNTQHTATSPNFSVSAAVAPVPVFAFPDAQDTQATPTCRQI